MRTFVLSTLLGTNYNKSDGINEVAVSKGIDFIAFKSFKESLLIVYEQVTILKSSKV